MTEEQKENLVEEVVRAVKKIKAMAVKGVVKNYEMRPIVNIKTGNYTGIAVILHLCINFNYNNKELTLWKKTLKADEWFISVNRSMLRVTFKVRYKRGLNYD